MCWALVIVIFIGLGGAGVALSLLARKHLNPDKADASWTYWTNAQAGPENFTAVGWRYRQYSVLCMVAAFVVGLLGAFLC